MPRKNQYQPDCRQLWKIEIINRIVLQRARLFSQKTFNLSFMQLVIKSLSKTYTNGVKAIKNVSLSLNEGMFGLLGPNGAGKSSLMRTVATLQEADEGSIFLDDIDVLKQKTEVRQVLGYLPQEFGVYPKISAEQMLDHIAQLKGISNKQERKEL